MKKLSSSILVATALLSSSFLSGQSPQAPVAEEIELPRAALVSYQVRTTTLVQMLGTPRSPQANGIVRVRGREQYFEVEGGRGDLRNLLPPWQYGRDFRTFVLWAVTPGGRAVNLGELLYEENRTEELKITTATQTFWLLVTAEPHFAVAEPSPAAVLVSISQSQVDTGNKGLPVAARAYYRTRATGYAAERAAGIPSQVPIYIQQATQSIEYAQRALQETGAADPEAALESARAHLRQAQNIFSKNPEARDEVRLYARTAVVLGETARVEAYESASRRRMAELEEELQSARRTVAAQTRELEDSREELARARQSVPQLEAALDSERQHTRDLESQILSLREQLSLQDDRLNALQERGSDLRLAAEAVCGNLATQLSTVGQLELRNSFYSLTLASDNLFDSGKFELKPSARVSLAKLLVLRKLLFPQAAVRYEGHTDRQGSEDFNRWLSEQRALSVFRYFLEEELAESFDAERQKEVRNILGDVNTMLGMSFNAVRRQPQRRQEWIDSLGGTVIGKGPSEPVVDVPGPDGRNRRVTIVFPKDQAGELASLCENWLIPQQATP